MLQPVYPSVAHRSKPGNASDNASDLLCTPFTTCATLSTLGCTLPYKLLQPVPPCPCWDALCPTNFYNLCHLVHVEMHSALHTFYNLYHLVLVGMYSALHTFYNLCHLVHVGMHSAVIVHSIHTEDEFGLNLSEPLQHTL